MIEEMTTAKASSDKLNTEELLQAIRATNEQTYETISRLKAALSRVIVESENAYPSIPMPPYRPTPLNHDLSNILEIVTSINNRINELLHEVQL